jgi:hypothetical protein
VGVLPAPRSARAAEVLRPATGGGELLADGFEACDVQRGPQNAGRGVLLGEQNFYATPGSPPVP